MKTVKNRDKQVEELMRAARKYPEGSAKRSRIVMQICRLYDPKRFSAPDPNTVEVEF